MSLPFEPRDEDPRLLTGAGRFADDERAAGEAHGVFVRSPHAFAGVRAIDTAAARAVPGVLAVLTAADMERAGVGNVTLAAVMNAVADALPAGAAIDMPAIPERVWRVLQGVKHRSVDTMVCLSKKVSSRRRPSEGRDPPLNRLRSQLVDPGLRRDDKRKTEESQL